MSSPVDLISAARKRIQRRNLLAGAAAGGWFGLGLAAAVILVSRLWWLDIAPPAWIVAVAVALVSLLAGALAGALRPVLPPRELALLVDRALGTDEALVTLLHLQERGHGSPTIRADLERRVAALPAIRDGLRAGPPRHARWLPLLLIAAALLLLIPARPPVVAPLGAVAQEAARLAEALTGTPDLPAELADKAKELIQELRDGDLTPEQAAEKLADLQREIAEYTKSELGDAAADLQAMEQAARALDDTRVQSPELAEATQRAADALEQRDPAAARQAAEAIADALDQANDQDRAEVGRSLEQAGQALEQAASQELRDLGQALEQAGRTLQTPEGTGQTAESGDGGSEGEGERSATDALRDLAKDPSQARELAERLQRDRERLRQSQEANGALEASRQRLGGEPGESAGEASEGNPAGGPGAGEPQTGLNAPPDPGGEATAGTGHTWEDEGTFDTVGGHQDQDRQGDRTAGRVVDDFEAFYDPQRLEGAEGLIVSVEGLIDESGHFDEIERRRTEGTETARRAFLDVPDIYREAAERELADDRIPPGYRSAIKDYFDSME